MKQYIIAIDGGTTNTRASLWQDPGVCVDMVKSDIGVRITSIEGSNASLKAAVKGLLEQLLENNKIGYDAIDGIYACGNVLHVHDLVDFVSEEADIAGTHAAAKILGETEKTVKSLEVATGFGVRYTVPERIDITETAESVRVFFRVTDVYKKVQLVIETESGEVIVKKAKSAVAPGEMESLEIPADKIAALAASEDKKITVYLRELGGNGK